MDKEKAAKDIIAHALPLVPFEGWNQQTLNKAALAAGYKKTDVIRVFPGGAIDAVDAFLRAADEQMLEALQGYHLDTMKIRERIATAVRLKLDAAWSRTAKPLRKAIALQALPFYAHRACAISTKPWMPSGMRPAIPPPISIFTPSACCWPASIPPPCFTGSTTKAPGMKPHGRFSTAASPTS